MDDEGRPFIWGYRVWNLEPPDETGKTLAVNVLAEEFIPCDGRFHNVTIQHPHEPDRKVERSIRCPDILWQGQNQVASK